MLPHRLGGACCCCWPASLPRCCQKSSRAGCIALSVCTKSSKEEHAQGCKARASQQLGVCETTRDAFGAMSKDREEYRFQSHRRTTRRGETGQTRETFFTSNSFPAARSNLGTSAALRVKERPVSKSLLNLLETIATAEAGAACVSFVRAQEQAQEQEQELTDS